MGVTLGNVTLGRILLKKDKDTNAKDISVWENVSVK